MQTNRKKIKTSIKIISTIVGIAILGLALPKFAYADLFGSFAKDLLYEIGLALQYIFNWLLRAAAAFFEGVLDIGFKNTMVSVKNSWEVTRDFANIFFILLMVLIAFATILRIEKYGIRSFLPKLIIVALLINFSLVFCSVIIDFSNIVADFFIKDIKKKIGDSEDEGGVITATFADSLNVTGALITYTNCEDYRNKGLKDCTKLSNIFKLKNLLQPMGWSIIDCQFKVDALYDYCNKYGQITVENEDLKNQASFLNLFLSMTVGSLILLIAAFVLFAGAILLLIRIIVIWLLVAIVPLAFLCYLMPGLSANWQKWWRTFINWCIFAPIYAFFVWMAMEISTSGLNKAIANSIKFKPISGEWGAGGNAFLANPGEQLISYGIIIAFLLGGLIMAQKLGIYGADTAMKIGQKWGRGAKDWAKRTSMRPVKAAGKAVGAGALLAGGKLFGGKLGRRMEAKGFQLRQKAAEEKQHKAFQGLLKTMSDEDVKKEMHTKEIRGFLATQEAKRRGVLREAKREDVGRAMETMRAHGAAEEARSLEELRPDAVKDGEKRGEAIERAIKEGTHKKWSEKVFESPEGAKIMGELQRQLGSTELTRVFKGWAKDIQTEAEKALKEGFSDNFDESTDIGKDNMGRRRTYAAVSGELDKAFYGYKDNKQLETKIRDYVGGWGNEDFKALNNPRAREARKIVIEFMKPSQVEGAAANLSGSVKEEMMDFAEQYNKPVFEQMQKSLGWGGKPPTTPPPSRPSEPPRIVDLKTSEEEFREAREKAKKESEKKYPGRPPFG